MVGLDRNLTLANLVLKLNLVLVHEVWFIQHLTLRFCACA